MNTSEFILMCYKSGFHQIHSSNTSLEILSGENIQTKQLSNLAPLELS